MLSGRGAKWNSEPCDVSAQLTGAPVSSNIRAWPPGTVARMRSLFSSEQLSGSATALGNASRGRGSRSWHPAQSSARSAAPKNRTRKRAWVTAGCLLWKREGFNSVQGNHNETVKNQIQTSTHRLIRRIRRGSFFRVSSCSQIRRTRQPSFRRIPVTLRSRTLFAASFLSQNAALFLGFVE